jgi:pSer/pThr/pTyr-binding forkhead associated (FHA) protein
MSVALDWDVRVSTLHARVVHAGGEWVLEDENWSKNGTYLNETRVDRSVRLHDKDVIRVGQTRLEFRTADGATRPRTTAVDAAPSRLPEFDPTDRAILVELCKRFFLEDAMVPVENKAIADSLGYGEDMVSARFRRMYSRAGINYGRNKNRGALMALVIRERIVTERDFPGR